MDRSKSAYSVKEAAALSGTSERAIRNELARGVISGRRGDRPGRVQLGDETLLYLLLLRDVPFALSRPDRTALHRLLAAGEAAGDWHRHGRHVCKGSVAIDTAGARRALSERLRLYRHGRARVVSDPRILGGEAVFSGTRLAVRHIGGIANKGVPLTEILADYPALSAADVAFAQLFTGMKRDPGRPPRRLRFRRGD